MSSLPERTQWLVLAIGVAVALVVAFSILLRRPRRRALKPRRAYLGEAESRLPLETGQVLASFKAPSDEQQAAWKLARAGAIEDFGIQTSAIVNQTEATRDLARRLLGERTAASQRDSPALDIVTCSVFAPPEISPGTYISVQVFLHLNSDLIVAVRQATEFDRTANRRGASTLTTVITRGSLVDLYLDCPTLIVEAPVFQQTKWQGAPVRAAFRARVPNDLSANAANVAIGTVHVGLDGVPIGEVRFELHIIERPASQKAQASLPGASTFVSASKTTTVDLQPVGTRGWLYQTAFISYSRADFREVSLFAMGLSEKGIKPTIDVSTLEPGDEWERQLPEFVERADVFYLMWSDNAATSRYVDWETRHAVGLHGQHQRPCIKPIPLEQPWPEPPDYLQRFHFYSEWQAHRAAQSIGLTKPAERPHGE